MTTIGILSDSHDNIDALLQARERLLHYAPHCLIHCGDIVSPDTLAQLDGTSLYGVFGNNDLLRDELQQCAARCGFHPLADELVIAIAEKQIAVYHGTSARRVQQLADSGRFDYVLTGHTHQRRDERQGGTRIINPGALYRASHYSCAVLDLRRDDLIYLEIDR